MGHCETDHVNFNVDRLTRNGSSCVDMSDGRDVGQTFEHRKSPCAKGAEAAFLRCDSPYGAIQHHAHDDYDDGGRRAQPNSEIESLSRRLDRMSPQKLEDLLRKVLQRLEERLQELEAIKHHPPEEPLPRLPLPEQPSPEQPSPEQPAPEQPLPKPPESPAPHSESIADILAQNDYSRRGIVTVDTRFKWGQGKVGTNGSYIENSKSSAVPDRVNRFGEWGVIMPEHGKEVDADAKISIKNASTFLHRKSGGWIEAKTPEQSQKEFWEGHFYTDFHGNLHTNGDGKLQKDGSYQFTAAPEGMLDHFGTGGVAFDPTLYDGVFTTMSVKADSAHSGLAMQIGGDYRRPNGITQNEPGQTAENLGNPAAGGNNWMSITDQWQTSYYTSLPAKVIVNDPPPIRIV